MFSKPPECQRCPLYGDGQGFVPGEFPVGAELLVLGQAPGEEEEREGIPLIGATGRALDRDFLPLAGVDADTVARDNVLRCRWKRPGERDKTNELPPSDVLVSAMIHCSQYDRTPDSIKLIIAMGTLALRKVAPGLKQHEWRGHLLPAGD